MRNIARIVLIAACAFFGAAVLPSAAQALPGQYVTTFAGAPGRTSACLYNPSACPSPIVIPAGSHLVACKVLGPTVVLGGTSNRWWLQLNPSSGRVYISAVYVDNWHQVENSVPNC
ncbi:hypothetical protein Aph01nite_80600 [Acrocarpospora phusangensis]|uniref:SH3b domain-containing protein n=1 Tax=Acrocarpospora phusangensis TaxID=1070424 RepID=A0A919UVU7_9ACTN|nr:hypothetical protein [Acrocarpospora phusangensis]GIH29750.1 hypothetical protein Aph01nite_80600 [Acrocarpospora phusangensis]